MREMTTKAALILGASLIVGLGVLGYLVQQTAIQYKALDRIVTVKGLSESILLIRSFGRFAIRLPAMIFKHCSSR